MGATFRSFVNEERTVAVQVWPDTTTVLLRDDSDDVWAPPITVTEERHSQSPATLHVVIDLETDDDWRRVLGQHAGYDEGVVYYYDPASRERRSAPEDCVRVVKVAI